MNESPQGEPPPDAVESQPQPGGSWTRFLGEYGWKGFFEPSRFNFEHTRMLRHRELFTQPFDFEVDGVKLVPLADDGSLFGTPDKKHTYSRADLEAALEIQMRLVQLARGADFEIIDDIARNLELRDNPDLLTEHPEYFIENGHLVQSPDEEKEDFDDFIFDLLEMRLRAFREGTLPSRKTVDEWLAQAEWETAVEMRRELEAARWELEGSLEAIYKQEATGK